MVLVIGGTIVLIGMAMVVLPGPAFIVIPAGIALLATEFAWARRLLRKVKARIRLAARKARGSEASSSHF
ncbi:MAG: PGPGW domain-containing protein [Candidatus Binatia bacterium]|nr:PGPGW domain-containing protein [Candidatus Binatia bacterium]